MPTKYRLFIYPVLLIYVSYWSSSSKEFFDHIFFLTWYMCPFAMGTLLGRYLVKSFTVSPGHDWKYSFWIFLIHVYLTCMNASAWRYLTKSAWFFMWYALFILYYMSLSSCVLPPKGNIHNPEVLSLVTIMIFTPLFMMWKFVCVKTALHTE